MKLVLKNIFFTAIFKYFVIPNILLCSGYVVTMWQEMRFLDVTLDSKWNILSQSCFCSLFSLLIGMYWFWIPKYIQTSHKNSFDTNYFTLKTGSWTEKGIEREGFHDVQFFFVESNGFSFQNVAAFEIIGTKAKSNSDDVFGHDTALLKISGHYLIEMSIFVVCWIRSFLRN